MKPVDVRIRQLGPDQGAILDNAARCPCIAGLIRA